MSEKLKIPVLDLKPQQNALKPEFMAAIERVIDSSAYIMGPDVAKFEEEAAKYIGSKFAIGVNSGTDALIIGLRAAGVGAGDEVITTPFSFFATAESISNVLAKPVFVDIEEGSMNINPEEIKKNITPKTKAILPVHLFGRPAKMDKIMAIAKEHNLAVIEDCAQSFGATYQGKKTGAIGAIGAYSFFPSKNLGGFGDGGLITTDDPKIADMCKMLRAHGSKKKYFNEVLGYNSHLDTIQAAILRVKLPHIDKWNQGRRRVAAAYNKALAGIKDVITPEVADGHVFHQYTIRVLGNKRELVQKILEEKGISTMIYYPVPQDRLPVYAGQYPKYEVSETLAREVISLPIWPELSEQTIGIIATAIGDALKA